MSRLFFDTSAIAKRFIQEAGSDAVMGYWNQADEIWISDLCLAELFSVINRLKREKKLGSSLYSLLKRHILSDLDTIFRIDLSHLVLKEAITCFETAHVKTLDAIQIASAIVISADMFFTSDKNQSSVAKKMGLNVTLV